MARGDRKTITLDPENLDSASVATWSLSNPQPSAFVDDDAVLLAHVKAAWPEGSVVTVEKVRESVVTAILAEPFDKSTGALVPGIDTRAGAPVLSLSQTKSQAAALFDAWRVEGVPELPTDVAVEFERALLGIEPLEIEGVEKLAG